MYVDVRNIICSSGVSGTVRTADASGGTKGATCRPARNPIQSNPAKNGDCMSRCDAHALVLVAAEAVVADAPMDGKNR